MKLAGIRVWNRMVYVNNIRVYINCIEYYVLLVLLHLTDVESVPSWRAPNQRTTNQPTTWHHDHPIPTRPRPHLTSSASDTISLETRSTDGWTWSLMFNIYLCAHGTYTRNYLRKPFLIRIANICSIPIIIVKMDDGNDDLGSNLIDSNNIPLIRSSQ